mgnify:CR=1 FL=1
MKLLRTVALFAICLTALLSAAGCSEKGTESFNAVITEITEDGITARPFEDEEILKKASVIRLDQSVLRFRIFYPAIRRALCGTEK